MSGDIMGPVGLGLQMAGQITNGLGTAAAERAKARQEEENARRAMLQGELDAQQVRRDARKATGEMLAGMGSANVALGIGSAADVIAQSNYERELDILNLRGNATDEANARYADAAGHRGAARNAIVSMIFNTASTAVSGAGQMRRDRLMSVQTAKERAAYLGGGTALGAR